MVHQQGVSPEGITRGHRIPNFALPARDELTLLFYEFAEGRPLLLGGCSTEWTPEECDHFARAMHDQARQQGLQSVVLTSGPIQTHGELPNGATAVDKDGAVRQRLFGDRFEDTDGAVLMADPNLRVLNGAAVEKAALSADHQTLASGISALIEDGLGDLRREAAAGPQAAPVLIIPRVLSTEVCRGLINSFQSWSPTSSPMPQSDGTDLAVDGERKSRLDAFIGDQRLERELAGSVAHRVLPELNKAFFYAATRFERFKLVCYPSTESGHFGAHRDNTAPATAHRRFALTLNLNAEDYEGGALAFPEYGPHCMYNVPTGSAILFSCTHAHRVQPVTKGERYALISFAFGEEAAVTAARRGAPPPPKERQE